MLDRISALLEANKHVSSAIAHDLRKPLARVLRGLESGEESGPPTWPNMRKRSTPHRATSTESLKLLARCCGSDKSKPGLGCANFKNVDLAAIAQEVAEAFQPAAADEGKTLTFELDARLPMAGDCELLKQLTANLIDNSIRHTPPGTRIEVRSIRDEIWRSIDCRRRRPGRRLRPSAIEFSSVSIASTPRARRPAMASASVSSAAICWVARRQSIRARQ